MPTSHYILGKSSHSFSVSSSSSRLHLWAGQGLLVLIWSFCNNCSTARHAACRCILESFSPACLHLSIYLSFSELYSARLLLSPSPLLPAVTQDRLGSRDGGTEVEGEAIYPRRIRRCVTEVWTVAAGQWRWQAPGRPAHMAQGLWDYRQMAPGGWQTINKPTRIAGSAVYPQAQEIARERVHLCSEHFHSLLFLSPNRVWYNSCILPMCLFHKNSLVVMPL